MGVSNGSAEWEKAPDKGNRMKTYRYIHIRKNMVPLRDQNISFSLEYGVLGPVPELC